MGVIIPGENPLFSLVFTVFQLASCLIYARAFIEYVCGCVLFEDVTVREIRGRYGAHFPYSP